MDDDLGPVPQFSIIKYVQTKFVYEGKMEPLPLPDDEELPCQNCENGVCPDHNGDGPVG